MVTRPGAAVLRRRYAVEMRDLASFYLDEVMRKMSEGAPK